MAKTSNRNPKNDHKRVLISVTVLGSTGPIRMMVKVDDSVTRVIRNALRLYAQEGRVPEIGSDPDGYFLYGHNGVGERVVMGAREAVGSTGERSFLMAPKSGGAHVGVSRTRPAVGLKSWISKSLSVKITRWVS